MDLAVIADALNANPFGAATLGISRIAGETGLTGAALIDRLREPDATAVLAEIRRGTNADTIFELWHQVVPAPTEEVAENELGRFPADDSDPPEPGRDDREERGAPPRGPLTPSPPANPVAPRRPTSEQV